MSDPSLAAKTLNAAIAEALATYKAITGVTLAQGDPRRLHLIAMVTIVNQQRGIIDFSGKQSLLRYVSDEWIDELAVLWGEARLPAVASECTQRFNFASSGLHTIPAGIRVADGNHEWEVVSDTAGTGLFVDATVRCTTTGSESNGVVPGEIDTLVDPDLLPGCESTANTTTTSKGAATEALEAFRTRLRSVPESRSTCGPRLAYEAAALEVSPTVADAVALSSEDADEMNGGDVDIPGDGEVLILIIQGTRDDDGNLLSVVPGPDDSLTDAVEEALSAETVRPLTDSVSCVRPDFETFNAIATYYVGRSRAEQLTQVQEDVEEAFQEYLLWQQSKIGRDINPHEMITRLVNAGAKRLVVTEPSFVSLKRDQSANCTYEQLVFGGVEDD